MWEYWVLQHLVLVLEPSAMRLLLGGVRTGAGALAPWPQFRWWVPSITKSLRHVPHPHLSLGVPPSPLVLQEQPLPLAVSACSPALLHHLSPSTSFPNSPSALVPVGFCSPCPYWFDWALLPALPAPSWRSSYPGTNLQCRGCTQEHFNGASDSLGTLG